MENFIYLVKFCDELAYSFEASAEVAADVENQLLKKSTRYHVEKVSHLGCNLIDISNELDIDLW